MTSTIKTNGLDFQAIALCFPMIHTIRGEYGAETVEVEHDQPLVYPTDEQVEAVRRDLQLDEIRNQRAPLLADADWRIQRAEDEGNGVEALRAYRQALRDVTAQPDPWAVVWPVKPWDDSSQVSG